MSTENSEFVILGSGALARDYLDVFGKHNCIGLFTPREYYQLEEVSGMPVYDDLNRFRGKRFVTAVGNAKARHALADAAIEAGLRLSEPVVHGSAVLSKDCELADGVIITIGVLVGSATIIRSNAFLTHHVVVGHDTEIGSHSIICPSANISGKVRIESEVFVGANAAIAPGVSIGSASNIAMGAAVFRDVPAGASAVGNPARMLGNE